MSLNWSASKVENFEAIMAEDPDNEVRLKTLVFGTMNCGVNPITEKNYEEFYRRLMLSQQVLVGGLRPGEFAEWIPLSFVKKMIGLGTNASTKSVTQFNKDIISQMESDQYHVLQEQKKLVAEAETVTK